MWGERGEEGGGGLLIPDSRLFIPSSTRKNQFTREVAGEKKRCG